jgi:quercetin 2,3-dioxygenase
VRVVAGAFGGSTGPVKGIVTDPLYLDARLDVAGRFETTLPDEHTAFIYAYEGRGEIEGTALGPKTLAILGPGDTIRAKAAEGTFRFLCVAARPLKEPIARYGPFVMNTREEIQQAFEDFRGGRFA